MGTSCNVIGCLLYQCSYEFLEKRLIERGKDSYDIFLFYYNLVVVVMII